MYAVFGLGMMGEVIAYDLLKHDSTSIVHGFEINEERRNYLKEQFVEFGKRFQVHFLDLNTTTPVEQNPLVEQIQQLGIDVVYGAIDYRFNLYLSKLCIIAGANYLDLGGNPNVVRSQNFLHEEAKEAGVLIIPDCGLAPGMANVIAARIMDKFETLHECHIRVGGLPQEPKTILNYQQVFSIRGLTNEYLEDAVVIRDGEAITVPSLTELEELSFPEPYSKLEAFQTAGGTSSLPEIYKGKIQYLTYKTIRYPGHCQFFQFLKQFGLLSSEPVATLHDLNPREVVEYFLEKNLPKKENDVVLVRITVEGIKDNQPTNITYQLIDLTDQQTGYSAMARTTSYPISIIGQLIKRGIIKIKGVIPGEIAVPENEFMSELEKRNIIFTIINE
jgi:lysine 6-dehydrogenase